MLLYKRTPCKGWEYQRSEPEEPLPTREHISGPLARIVAFVRANERCPIDDFFRDIEPMMRKKFNGQFDALTKQGSIYSNGERFKPLHGAGKPLWEFKEHGHRLYCYRKATPPSVFIVLLSGWVKQKKGKTDKEEREIKRAMDLHDEFIHELGGNS
jgi:hypothetical protein